MEARNSRKLLYFYLLASSFLFAGFNSVALAESLIADKPYLTLASNTFVFNPRNLTWTALSNGKVIKSGKAIGGSRYCRDIGRSCKTPTGTYRVYSKGGAGCRSSRYPVGRGGAKMPYCMFFAKNYAVHGSYEMPNYNASHGCIRVQPDAARWLNQNFMQIGTTVIVKPY